MFDHVDLHVSDLEASSAFYARVLAPLGIERGEGPLFEFGALSLVAIAPRDRLHLAVIAESLEEVDAFHQAGVEGGYRSNGAPGIRSRYAPDYYAAYLLDPDGHNVEAVHRSAETRSRWSWLGRGLV